MSFEFELFDLISLLTILIGLVATYHKIVARLQITEMRVADVENDINKNEEKFTKDVEYIHTKMNKKLDEIHDQQTKLLVEVTKLSAK